MDSLVAPFACHLPVRIRFGDGVVAELPDVLASLGVRRPFVLVDPHVRGLPSVAAALAALAAGGAAVAVVEPPPGEPTLAAVDDLGAAVAAHAADAVVAIGGGAVLDAAKGARLVACAGGPVARYAWPGEPEPVPPLAVPVVTVPTTAGTGSEVTGGVVMVDPATHRKVAAASPHNRAAAALVDPVLTHGLPAAPTLYGGADAVAQGLAAVVCAARNPVGDALGLEAARVGAPALRAVVADPGDADARSRMACASLLAGLAMNVSEAGTEHSLAHPLGSLLGLPHGLTVGLVLAESLEHDARHVPDRLERVADALGEAPDGTADGSRAVRAVRRLLADVGFPTMRAAGVREEHVEALVEAALAGWIPVEPGPWTREDVAAAYRRALAIERRSA